MTGIPDKAAVTRRRRLRFLGDFPSRDADRPHSLIGAFTAVALVGVLGGMIGLGGAEFRLPLLIGLFGFVALQAVVLNEAMSLLVVLTALPARLFSVPWSSLSPLVRSGQPARRQPGRCLGGGDLGDADEVAHVVPGARGAAGPGRRRAGVEPFRSCRGAGSTAGRATCRSGRPLGLWPP